MSKDPLALPYRPNVGLMLMNRAGLIFVARRADTPDAWQMPQGGVDKGEDYRAAALRELQEEIGTDRAEIVAESAGEYTYDLPEHLIGRIWGGKWRGQRQKWFLLRFTGQDSDIDLTKHDPEFDAWKWVPLAEVPTLIVPFKRAIYDAVCAEFAPLVTPG
ncbi:MAG TPA: RNA pyrophosphohydrolase [Alphaproteobacteria bacterium]|nr:RNA pyrophosphohydrolase [Alphaproteobacteria bacterium]